jgi:hypothetical protein
MAKSKNHYAYAIGPIGQPATFGPLFVESFDTALADLHEGHPLSSEERDDLRNHGAAILDSGEWAEIWPVTSQEYDRALLQTERQLDDLALDLEYGSSCDCGSCHDHNADEAY